MREDTMVAENSVLVLARIATQLREIAAELDSIAVDTVTQETPTAIALPENLSTNRIEEQEIYSDSSAPAQKAHQKPQAPQFRSGMPRFGGGFNPFFALLTGMGGGSPMGSFFRGGNTGGNPLGALLGGGTGGGLGALLGGGTGGGLGALLGGGTGGGLGALLGGGTGGGLGALLGGGTGGGNPLAALLGGNIGDNNILSLLLQGNDKSPISSLLGDNSNLDLNDILKNPETLSGILSGDKEALEKLQKIASSKSTEKKEDAGSDSGKSPEPASQETESAQEQPGKQEESGNPQAPPAYQPYYQPYQPGSYPFYQHYPPQAAPYMTPRHPFMTPPFIAPGFSFSAARAVRTPTPADAQYLDALLKKWQVF